MSAAERNFSTYYLGDDVRELADGVIPVMAEFVGIDLPQKPTEDEPGRIVTAEDIAKDYQELDTALGALVGVLGKDKVLRNNVEVPVHPGIMGGLVQSAGTQEALSRSLQSPEFTITGSENRIVTTGAVAPWMQRTATLILDGVNAGRLPGTVDLPTGNRLMKGPTDITEAGVLRFQENHNGQLPTEAQYVEEELVPRFEEAGLAVNFVPYDTAQGKEIAERFAKDNPDFFLPGQKIVFARVANAGIQLAGQFVRAVRKTVVPQFDSDSASPQAYVLTDSHPVGFTRAQAANPREYQSPYTGSRQVAVTARTLHQLGQ